MRVSSEHLGRTGACGRCKTRFHIAMDSVATVLDPSDSSTEVPHDGPAPEEGRMEWRVGDVILDLYAVTDLLGEGGMGKVFKVHHLGWDVDLAVKCPKTSYLRKKRAREAFQRECETWVNLGLFPHIVSCYYVRQLGGLPRIFAEYVDGGTLWQWVVKRRLYTGGEDASIRRILAVAMQLAWGLGYAHERGVIHRDMKTSNVLLTRRGEVKVTDFGLAAARMRIAAIPGGDPDAADPASGGMTPAYCSPEQHRREAVDHRTDIYSWAVCVLEMLCGRKMWERGIHAPHVLRRLCRDGSPHDYVPRVPEGLAVLLARCFDEDPSHRPDDMREVADALRGIHFDVFKERFPLEEPKAVEKRAESLNNRAVSLMDLGKTGEALAAWEQALESQPMHPESAYNAGLVRWRQGLLSDEALVQQLRRIRQMHAGDALPHLMLAQTHLERGDCRSAGEALDKAGEAGPADARVDALRAETASREDQARHYVHGFEGHADGVNVVRLSQRGSYAYSGSRDNTIKVWDLAKRHCVRTLTGHTDSVDFLVLNASSDRVVSAGRDKTLRVWDVTRGEEMSTLRGHEAAIAGLAAGPAFRKAVSVTATGRLHVWSLERFEQVTSFQLGRTEPLDIAMTSDGEAVVTGHRDGTVQFWELGSRECLRTWRGHEGPVTCVGVSPHDRYLLSGGEDGTIRLWETAGDACLRVMAGHVGEVTSVRFGRDGRTAVSAGKDGSVRLWQVSRGRCLRTYRGHEGTVASADLSGDVRMLVSAGQDGSVKLWRAGKELRPYLAPFSLCEAVRSEAALSNEIAFVKALEQARNHLAVGDAVAAARAARAARSQPGFQRNSAAMEVWSALYTRLPRGKLQAVFEAATLGAHQGAVRCMDIDPLDRWLLTGGEDGIVGLWDLASGARLLTLEAHAGPVSSVRFHPARPEVYTAGADNAVRRWDCRDGTSLGEFQEQGGNIETVAVSPDGALVATGGWTVALWLPNGNALCTFGTQLAAVFEAEWLPDAHALVTACSDQRVRVWNVGRGEVVHEFGGFKGAVASLALSADGVLMVASGVPVWRNDSEVALFSLDSGNCVATFEGHTGKVNSVAISTDGRYVLTGSADNSVRLWEAATGECLRVLAEELSNVQSVRFSHNACYAIAGTDDGLVQSWFLDWKLKEQAPAPWDERAGRYLDAFVAAHRPLGPLPDGATPDADTLERAFRRKGAPQWEPASLERFLYTLGCAGFGWLSAQGVQEELQRRSRQSAVLRWLGLGRGGR